MIFRRSLFTGLLCCLLGAASAFATWYDDYEAGIKAVQGGKWQVAVQKMTAAIAQKKDENDKARAYGTLFENYHPYYYRAVAEIYLGQYQKAIEDLDKASGPGDTDMGSIENLHQRAELKLAQAAQTQTEPPVAATTVEPPVTHTVAPPVIPPPVTVTTAPAQTIDPGMRQRADNALVSARQKLESAKQRKATGSPRYGDALAALSDANLRRAGARTNEDLGQVIAQAENAGLMADAAIAPAPGVVQPPLVPKQVAATNAVLGDVQRKVRGALEHYFNGDFDKAATEFQGLASGELADNGLIWAFLGASQYSLYAFEADEQYRDAAKLSFDKAKRLRPRLRSGLPQSYFSRRIRAFFNSLG